MVLLLVLICVALSGRDQCVNDTFEDVKMEI